MLIHLISTHALGRAVSALARLHLLQERAFHSKSDAATASATSYLLVTPSKHH